MKRELIKLIFSILKDVYFNRKHQQPYLLIISNTTDEVKANVEALDTFGRTMPDNCEIDGVKYEYGIPGVSYKQFLGFLTTKPFIAQKIKIIAKTQQQLDCNIEIKQAGTKGWFARKSINLSCQAVKEGDDYGVMVDRKVSINGATSLKIEKLLPNSTVIIQIFDRYRPFLVVV